MTITSEQSEIVDAFLDYLDGEFSGDERYGPAERYDRKDESSRALRFSLGPNCWIEAAVRPAVPEVRVGFVTDERSIFDEILNLLADAEETPSENLERALADAGLPWEDPVVDQETIDERFHRFSTPLKLEVLDDLDLGFMKVRSKVPKMIEAYLVAFGSAIVMDMDDDEE
ncbi:MAG: hypothetical protein ACE5E5_11790 [Phycisphaerae bacterium]